MMSFSYSTRDAADWATLTGTPESRCTDEMRVFTAPAQTLTVDASRRMVKFNQFHIRLKATSCRILMLLLRNQGHVVSRQTIYKEIWGYEFDPGTKIIDVQICYLRKLLRSLQAPLEIKTIRGKGLCLQATAKSH